VAQSLQVSGRYGCEVGGDVIHGSQHLASATGLPNDRHLLFDARNKTGREVIDHYQGLGKDGMDMFLREARGKDIFASNSKGKGDLLTPKHLLCNQPRFGRSNKSVNRDPFIKGKGGQRYAQA